LLLKDGQISILRSNWGDDDDDHYVWAQEAKLDTILQNDDEEWIKLLI
jgi:hypothetical protein